MKKHAHFPGGFVRDSSIVVIVTAVTVLMLEIFLRLLVYFEIPPSPIYRTDTETGLRVRPGIAGPNGITTNRGGFNDREHGADGPEVVFVGDSFTFGVDRYQEVFPYLVEEKLKDRGLSSVNLGVPSIGPDEYVKLIKFLAIPRKPDVIVVTIFIGNDIQQSLPGMETKLFFGNVKSLQNPLNIPMSLNQIYLMRAFGMQIRSVWRYFKGCNTDDARHTNDFLRETYQSELDVYQEGANIMWLLKRIHEMNSLIESGGSIPLFVIAPSEMQINNEIRDEILSCMNGNSEYDFKLPQRVISSHLSKQGISHVDLLPVMAAHSGGKGIYMRHDIHWNRTGNEIAADSIEKKLRQILNDRK